MPSTKRSFFRGLDTGLGLTTAGKGVKKAKAQAHALRAAKAIKGKMDEYKKKKAAKAKAQAPKRTPGRTAARVADAVFGTTAAGKGLRKGRAKKYPEANKAFDRAFDSVFGIPGQIGIPKRKR